MASKPRLFFAIWTVAATYASAATPTLPSEITGLIPSCALDCFQSFVSSNYDTSGCGISPSLSCLCQKTGTSGFTMGEGAVQCLVAEISRASCRGDDTSRKWAQEDSYVIKVVTNRVAEQAISKVYAMCSGVQNAAPETHATIVATLVVPSGTGPVQVPGGGSTTVASLQTSIQGSTSDAATITPVITMSTTASPSGTATSTSTSASSASASTSNGPALNTAQIAGISVGIAATLAFAVGLIFLARCVRKRNFGDQESVLFKPKRESKGFGMLKSNQNSPRALQISAPIHKTPIDMDFRRPGDFQRRIVPKPQIIGLALSPPRSATATVQTSRAETPTGVKQHPGPYIPYRPGVLGLPKPALSLSIPQEQSQIQKEARTLQSSRDSVVTEFQEDGEGESVGGSNIWRPPPTDPQSTTTYYVADKWGNWVLSSRDRGSGIMAELPGAMNEAESERVMDAATGFPVDGTIPNPDGSQMSKPVLAPQKISETGLGPPIEFKDRERAPISSSVHSAFSIPHSVAAGHGNPLSSALPAVVSMAPAQQGSAAAMKGQGLSRGRKSIHGSRQNKRRSQDSATTISSSVAEGDGEGGAIGVDPQDGLSPVVESPRTPVPSGRSPTTYPRPPSAARETPERRSQQGYKPLPTPPKGQQPTLTLFPRPARNGYVSPPRLNSLGQPNPTLGVADVSPLTAQTRRNPSAAQSSAKAKQQFTRAPGLNPNPLRNPSELRTGSPESVDSTGSSFLLTKRLGADRAATLTLAEDFGAQSARRVKWQRDQEAPGFIGQDTAAALPATPSWLPKLTPTRRGDDLFLNVQ
jgi:hypothetical protein